LLELEREKKLILTLSRKNKLVPLIIGLEDIKNFKDVEVTFSEPKYRDSYTDFSIDEEQEDKVSEENLPRRSGRKASKFIKEEQANTEIKLNSQNTIPKMLGTTNSNIGNNNTTSKG